MTDRDQKEIGDTICGILSMVYVEKRSAFERHAAEFGISLEQLAAAAIAEFVRQRLGQAASDPSEN